jgi:dynein heavy chain 1, cytosolic
MFVTEIQEMQPNYDMWLKDLDKFKSGNKLLTAQRYQFPYDWLGIEIIESEWMAFKKILETKTTVMHQ